jgi:hypothetical protein
MSTPAINLTQAQASLANWLAADAAVARSQSYKIAGRELSRADAGQIREQIKFWQGHVERLSRTRSGLGFRRVLPR